ncbi:MAG: hypothetical protein B6D61_12095 [Bacteroidetes bacterium 4484_249]|nr:MAG: hypothetical protein B6D61_12095 [Bacteroidetes bacterium 4484_249]
MKSKLTSKHSAQLFASVLFLSVLLMGFRTTAQTDESLLGYQEDLSYDSEDAGSMAEFNFTGAYKINVNTSQNGITLNDVKLLKKPYAKSEKVNVQIPKGTNIKTYKLLVKEGYWAVNYENNWGFIPISSVMQIKDDQNALTLSKCDIPPRLRTGLNIKFPAKQKSSAIEGEVVFNILIDKSGQVKEFHLVSGINELNDAATHIIKKLKFKPGKYQGQPVEVWMRYPVSFNNK